MKTKYIIIVAIILLLIGGLGFYENGQINNLRGGAEAAADTTAMMLAKAAPAERSALAKKYYIESQFVTIKLDNVMVGQNEETLPSGRMRQIVFVHGEAPTDLRSLIRLPPAEFDVTGTYDYEKK